MGFQCLNTQDVRFQSFEELFHFIKEEKESVERVPVENFLKQKAFFQEDQFWGKRPYWVCFNDDGFSALCRLLGIPSSLLREFDQFELATQILNDRLRNPEVQERLRNYDLVVDKRTEVVLGVVSRTYVGYSNFTFVENIRNSLPRVFKEFQWVESYSINTRLYLRFLSSKYYASRIVEIEEGTEDKSQIGFELRNSMVGTAAVSAAFFVYRLVCANGLLLPASKDGARVIHSGKTQSFEQRIKRRINPIFAKLRWKCELIEKLMDIPFNPEKLVRNKGAQLVYEIIGLSKSERIYRSKLVGNKKTQFDIDTIADYLRRYAVGYSRTLFQWRRNYSMFDFINIFTEYAKDQPLKRQLAIEESAGRLANWIYENRKKFI